MATFSASRAVPALPGATNTRSDAGALRDFPGQGVFPSAAANDQYVHADAFSAVVLFTGSNGRF